MLRLSLVCVLLSLLLIQVLGGNAVEKKKAKASTVCTAIPAKTFLGHTVAAVYPLLGDSKDVVGLGGCPVDLPKTSPLGSPFTVTEALRTLTEIKYWVCSNLRRANTAGVKTYIDTRFYSDLVGAIDAAQSSLRLISRYNYLRDEDALDIVTISAAARAIKAQVAQVARRLPCFCRLLKVMGFPLKSDREHNSAMCHALLATKKLQGPSYANVHKAATEAFWFPMLGMAELVPTVALLREESCMEANLDGSWADFEPTSWFDCAAVYSLNGYEVYMAPKGLMLYHGSHRMQPMHVPTGMMWFGEKYVASIYLDQPHTASAEPENPLVHSFRTTKNIFLVRLMNHHNNELMAEALDGLDSGLSLEDVTGYPHKLRRFSHVSIDKPVFASLCRTWPMGIAGYADNFPPADEDEVSFHPELFLCQTQGFIEPLGPVPRIPPAEPAAEPEPEHEAVEPGTEVVEPETGALQAE